LRVARSGQAGGGACRRKRPKSLPGSTGMLGGCLTLSIMSSAPQLRPSAVQRYRCGRCGCGRAQMWPGRWLRWSSGGRRSGGHGRPQRRGREDRMQEWSGSKGERGGDRCKRERAVSERERAAGVSAAARSASSSCSACPPLSARGTCRRRAAPRRTHANRPSGLAATNALPRVVALHGAQRAPAAAARSACSRPPPHRTFGKWEWAEKGPGPSGNQPSAEAGTGQIGNISRRNGPKWESA